MNMLLTGVLQQYEERFGALETLAATTVNK
jgi:hypothetical protein